jgi:peptidoglycan hydrolase-like protein with peptidoglycan-binding domain
MLAIALPRTAAMALLLVTVAGLGVLARPHPALASGPCTDYAERQDRAGYVAHIPSIGYQGSLDCWMARGAQGNGVYTLQSALDHCYQAGLATDGRFGPLTQQALKNVQARLHIQVDGVYGPQTRDAMDWPWVWYWGASPPYNYTCHKRL